jgi:hypothetical protein
MLSRSDLLVSTTSFWFRSEASASAASKVDAGSDVAASPYLSDLRLQRGGEADDAL